MKPKHPKKRDPKPNEVTGKIQTSISHPMLLGGIKKIYIVSYHKVKDAKD